MSKDPTIDRRGQIYPNPITAPLNDFTIQVTKLTFVGTNIFPSSVIVFVLGIIILMLCILWPYGILVISTQRLWDFVISTRDEMLGKTLIEKVPYTITVGIFFLIWLPFFLICSPFYLIGIIGRQLSISR